MIDIIGYDPSSYFIGGMSYENIENIRRGNIIASYQSISEREQIAQLKMKKEASVQLKKIEGIYKHDNLNSNLN